MAAKLHRFATKIAVHDWLALSLEQIVIKKLKSPNLRVKNWPRSEQHFKKKILWKNVHFVLSNSTQSPIT